MRKGVGLAAGLAALVALGGATARAQSPGTAETNAPPADPAAPGAVAQAPPSPTSFEESEVKGTCRTPHEAMGQLLYWLQAERRDRDKAAVCMDGSELPDASALPNLAFKLLKVLDGRALLIDPAAIPAAPNYTDPKTRAARFQLPELPQVEIAKVGERWLFSAATVARIPKLYEDTYPGFIDPLVQSLPDVFHRNVLGLTLWQMVGLLVLLIAAATLQKVVVYVLRTYVSRLAGKLGVQWVDAAAERVARPIGGLTMATILYVGIPWLQFSITAISVGRAATKILAVLSSAWLGYRLIDVLCDWLQVRAGDTATKLDDQLVPMLRKVLKVFTVVVGGIFVLQNLEVNVGSLLAGLGLGGLAFALAAKDSIANIFGSLVIFIDKPFQIGDWVVIGGVEGVVEEVGFRTTRVRTFYNSLVTVPNAQMTNISIDNYGMRRYRRYTTTLGLCYDTPPEKMQAFCEGVRAIIQASEGMRQDYFLVEFRDFGASALEVLVYCFMDVPDWGKELRVRTHLNLEILRLAEQLGVSFAFPTQTLHIETRARETDIQPAASLTPEQLRGVVRGFGPQGALSRPTGIELTYGYDAGTPPPRGEREG